MNGRSLGDVPLQREVHEYSPCLNGRHGGAWLLNRQMGEGREASINAGSSRLQSWSSSLSDPSLIRTDLKAIRERDDVVRDFLKRSRGRKRSLSSSIDPRCPRHFEGYPLNRSSLALTFIPSLLFSWKGLRGERKKPPHPSGILHSSHSEHFNILATSPVV